MALFGTDGIRGIFGKDLGCDTAFKLGGALTEISEVEAPIIVTGSDTRESGSELLSALVEGIIDKGGNPVNIGILPTAAVAYFTRVTGAQFGVMVSASHNPPEYNGLKVFDKTGVKLCRTKEKELERIINREEVYVRPMTAFPVIKNARDLYLRHLIKRAPNLTGMNIALDCGHGAAGSIAREAFESAGAKVLMLNESPDGTLINFRCGATDTCGLERVTKRGKYRLGFAFDGDADRLAVVEGGYPIHTESVFYIFSRYLYSAGLIHEVVGTVVTNAGLEENLSELGIKVHRSNVGDREVYALMNNKGARFGGESSGHYILSAYGACADAVANALLLAGISKDVGSLSEYASPLRLKPSALLNIPDRISDETRKQVEEKAKEQFGDSRIVLRKSGTEPKIRILVESSSCERANEVAARIAEMCGGEK